ncbi:MAG: DUF4031 domain-containing protein [Candidatus Aminicenantes bacterium]|nr:DUF4031 domain-containing protein [Candidatus Aminicenantes bacterium]
MIYVSANMVKWVDEAAYVLLTDNSLQELHTFAAQSLGLDQDWFFDLAAAPAYWLDQQKKLDAIASGARTADTRRCKEIVEYWKNKSFCGVQGQYFQKAPLPTGGNK